jgi:predicted ATPase/DNA-binding SARP family transcriptional activator
MLSEPWRIYLLGTFRFKSGNLQHEHCATRKTEELLGFLAYNLGKQCSRTELTDKFWMDSEVEAAQTNLRVALSSLRKQLEPPGVPVGSVLMKHGRTCVSLNPEAVSCDVVDFRRLLKHRSGLSPEERMRRLLAAIDLYKGELMPGHNEEWIEEIRNDLARQFFSALKEVTNTMVAAGDVERALEHALRAVQEEPLSEETHCELMRLYAMAGRPEEAILAYEHMTRVFERAEIGRPSRQAWRLYEQVKASSTSASGLETLPGHGTRSPSSPPDEPESRPMRQHEPGTVQPAPPAATPVPPPRPVHEVPSAVPPRATPVQPPPTPRPARRRAAGSSIPMQFTRFFGRGAELDRLQAYVEDQERLITLIGPGGTGKTRLAVEFARRMAEQGSRVAFVPLADENTAEAALVRMAEALQVMIRPGTDILTQVENELQEEPALLILDNLEQIVDAMAPVILRLISNVASLCIVVTTRHALELTGEQLMPVEPLPVPEGEGTPEELMQCPSVQLFVDRAMRVVPDFSITNRNAADVAEVCRRLEGLPLSLELAASWAQERSPRQMIKDLGQKFELLVSRKRDMPERHATLHACLEWSYRLLDPTLAHAFASLSVFRGGFTSEAVEHVLAVSSSLSLLRDLRSRSLITVDRSGEEPRYGMLEALQLFADEKLDDEMRATLRRRHAAYYAQMCREAEPHLQHSGQFEWLPRLSAETANVRAALQWNLANDPPAGVAMGRDLGRFWVVRGHWTEGREWLTQCAEAARTLHDTGGEGSALCLLAFLTASEGQSAQALEIVSAGVELLRQHGDPILLVRGLGNYGVVQQLAGDFAAARAAYEEARALAEARHADGLTAALLCNLSGLAALEGDLEGARASTLRAIEICCVTGDHWLRGVLLMNLGDFACEAYDAVEARSRYLEALPLLAAVGDQVGAGHAVRQLAAVLAYERTFRCAAVLLGAAARCAEASGVRLTPDECAGLEETIAEVRRGLPMAAFEKAWDVGQSLDAADVPDWLKQAGAVGGATDEPPVSAS